MKEKTKNIILIILSGIILVFLVPLLISVMFKFNFSISFLQSEWDAGDALAFYGALLSGALTVVGVFLTIRNENNKAKKDDSIKYKPILELHGINLSETCGYREVGLGYSISLSNNNPNKELIEKFFLENLCGKQPKYKLFFKNVGRGETYNARLENFEVHSLNWEDISNLSSNYSTPQYIGEINKDGYLGVYVYLPNYLILPKDSSSVKYFDLCTKLTISYSDMFDRIKYKSILCVHHRIKTLESPDIAPEVSDENYHYVKVEYLPYDTTLSKIIFSKRKGDFINEHEYIVE